MAEPIKIVARYRNGEMVKGTTHNFTPSGVSFHVFRIDATPGEQPTVVSLTELKAVFFVETFEGDADHDYETDPDAAVAGRRTTVEFTDGETMMGGVLQYSPHLTGFFLFPADAEGNNKKVFIVNSSVQNVIAA